jgi:hypothetical protein
MKTLLNLSEKDSFLQMLEGGEPKEILRKLLKKKKKSWGNRRKRKFLSALQIDVKNCNPHYMFHNTPFKRKEMENDTFLFIDKDYKILGVLKGSKWNKEWEEFEDFKSGNGSYSFEIKKNRKSLSQRAFHILRFSQKEQLRKVIRIIDHDYDQRNVIENRQKRFEKPDNYFHHQQYQKLEYRLRAYKIKKYSYVSFEQIKKMCSDLMVYLSQHIHCPENIPNIDEKLSNKIVRVRFSYISNIGLSHVLKNILEKFESLNRDDGSTYDETKVCLIDMYKIFLPMPTKH